MWRISKAQLEFRSVNWACFAKLNCQIQLGAWRHIHTPMFLEEQTTNINVTDLIEVSNNQTIQMIVLSWYFSSLIHVISLYYKSMTHALWTWYALREFYTSNPLSKLSKGPPQSACHLEPMTTLQVWELFWQQSLSPCDNSEMS